MYSDALLEITYAPGQTIYTLGDPSENVFIIKSGKVQLELFFEL
jgi:CRP-like cAMP-binding protein